MDQEPNNWWDKWREERNEKIKEAKAALFACVAEKCPQIARITARYSGSGDEGCVDEVCYFGTGGEPIDFNDEMLAGLVDELFQYVTPVGFETNDGGDGEIHVDAATQKVVVEHNQNVVHQESNTYEA
jgi:hypothetical protein